MAKGKVVNNTIHVQDGDGQFKGRVSLGGKVAPAPSDVPVDAGEAAAAAPDYGNAFQAFTAATAVRSTGKQGTDVPPLVVETKDKGRYYVGHPQYRDEATLNIDRALAEGKAFPSVTTVVDALKKDAMTPNAIKLTALAAEAKLYEISRANPERQQRLISEALATNPRTHRSNFRTELGLVDDDNKDVAASRGTEVHALVEAISKGENPDVPEEFAGYVAAYRGFLQEFPDMEYSYTECTLLNEEAGTMGTADAIVKIDGKYYVIDYKTNKNATVYETTGLQLAAGANAKWIVYPDGSREEAPAISGGLGIGLGPDGRYGVYDFETGHDGENYKGFLAARAAWGWQHAHQHHTGKPISRTELAYRHRNES